LVDDDVVSRPWKQLIVPILCSSVAVRLICPVLSTNLCIYSLIIIRLNYYLTSRLTKIETVTRTSQATFTAECTASIQERP
jgi:hypothetical protein